MKDIDYKTIEDVVAKHFGICVDDMKHYRKRKPMRVTDARHFVWYILCRLFGYRTEVVAKDYGTTTRNIQIGASMVSDGLKNQPFYSRHLAQITDALSSQNVFTEGLSHKKAKTTSATDQIGE